jgi:hypothetical protein
MEILAIQKRRSRYKNPYEPQLQDNPKPELCCRTAKPCSMLAKISLNHPTRNAGLHDHQVEVKYIRREVQEHTRAITTRFPMYRPTNFK